MNNEIKDIISKMDSLHAELQVLADEIVSKKPLKVGDFVLYHRPMTAKKGKKTCPGFVGFVAHNLAWVYTLDKYNKENPFINHKECKAIKIINIIYDYDNYVVVTEKEVEAEYIRLNNKSWRIK